MLEAVFLRLLSRSMTASLVIGVVLLARLLLKKAPKIYSYLLWALVLIRLLCPAFPQSSLSLLPEQPSGTPVLSVPAPGGQEAGAENGEIQEIVAPDGGHRVYYLETAGDPASAPPETGKLLLRIGSGLWLTGMILMLLYGLLSCLRVRRQVRVSVPLGDRVYVADDISMPFVMGLFPPVIYLPGTLEAEERRFIIAHERHHIRRGDPVFKALGFLALALHWFNPLAWLSFHLAGRDMEMSCDEAVIRKLGEGVRAEYSASLLNLAAGKRLFAWTPLAFGEGDPTGRVRNLAAWKRPALWVILLCVLLCAVLAVSLLTDPRAEAPEQTQPLSTVPETEAVEEDWGVSLVPDRVSRTGATALFRYGGATELTYGDDLSLERLVDGAWVSCEELPGYHHFVGDSSYPIADGYGMVHEWQNRFGELPDGHYRLGKEITRPGPGGAPERRMVYGEFRLPEDILVGMIPLEELPELYSTEQAMIDGCFVQVDGVARENKELFREFAANAGRAVPGVIRIVNWHYGENHGWSAMDLYFDGTSYTLKGVEHAYTFRYLKCFTGEKAWENADHDGFEYYVLVNDDTLTWEDIASGSRDMSSWETPAHWTVYAEYFYTPKQLRLPQTPARAVLEFEGQPLVTVTDFDRLEKIWLLFGDADILGYEPKTHSVGVGLNLILTGEDGEKMTVELDPDHDICRVNGEFVFYGAFDEPNYAEKLWYYLGISAWPDPVYEACPGAYRPQLRQSSRLRPLI